MGGVYRNFAKMRYTLSYAHLVRAEVCAADQYGQVGEGLKPTDCKSVTPCELRSFESFPVHQFNSRQAVVAQLVEHFLGKEEVTGSIPVNGSSSFGRK